LTVLRAPPSNKKKRKEKKIQFTAEGKVVRAGDSESDISASTKSSESSESAESSESEEESPKVKRPLKKGGERGKILDSAGISGDGEQSTVLQLMNPSIVSKRRASTIGKDIERLARITETLAPFSKINEDPSKIASNASIKVFDVDDIGDVDARVKSHWKPQGISYVSHECQN
jgi:hypothetical protein